jgi:hypothetical protein
MSNKVYYIYEVQQFGKTVEWTDKISEAEAAWKNTAETNGSTVFYKKLNGRKFEVKRK